MLFNEQQSRLWCNMISSIEDFRKGRIQYSTLVYGLEGTLDAGEFKDENIVEQWYDYWTPLEILSATKGDSVTVKDVERYLSVMETFLKSFPLETDSFANQGEEGGNTKIGDVFSVKIDENYKKYFQLIAFDLTQLNSDVIRAFKKVFQNNENPDLFEIITSEIEFYAHCVTKIGIKMGYWEKVGNITEIGEIDHILFRDSGDYGNPEIRTSEDWWVWKINEQQRRVGKLIGENQKSEIGLVINPESIIYRMRTGGYDFKAYPGF
jgi:Immunity protein 26